jgi:hypothetical protein
METEMEMAFQREIGLDVSMISILIRGVSIHIFMMMAILLLILAVAADSFK